MSIGNDMHMEQEPLVQVDKLKLNCLASGRKIETEMQPVQPLLPHVTVLGQGFMKQSFQTFAS